MLLLLLLAAAALLLACWALLMWTTPGIAACAPLLLLFLVGETSRACLSLRASDGMMCVRTPCADERALPRSRAIGRLRTMKPS